MADFRTLLAQAEAAIGLFNTAMAAIVAIKESLGEQDLADLEAMLTRAAIISEEIGNTLDLTAAAAAEQGDAQ